MPNIAELIKFPVKNDQTGGRMADLSNGYTRVANEIQKLKPRLKLSGREWQCFEAVIWLTYGWNKKSDRVTNTVIAELTELSDSHVSDALKSLAERKIIFLRKQGTMKTVGVNTDLSAWILHKPKTGKVFPKPGNSFPKSGKTFPKTVDTQDYNNKQIKRSSSENSDESSDKRLKDFLSAHPEAAIYTPSGAKWGTAEDLRCAEWIFNRVKTIYPAAKTPNWKTWSNSVRLMRQIDDRTHREIAKLFDLANRDGFWCENIRSPGKLREKWEDLTIKLGGQKHANNSGASAALQRVQADRRLRELELERGAAGVGPLGIDDPDLREPLDAEEWEQTQRTLDHPGWEHDADPDDERL